MVSYAGDACACEVMPVLFYRVAGAWVLVTQLRAQLEAVMTDAKDLTYPQVFAVVHASAWVIACPRCRYVYTGREGAPLSPVDDVAEVIDPPDDGIVWSTPRVLDVDVAGGVL